MELEGEVWRARKVLYNAYFGKGRYTPRGSTDDKFFHFLEKLLALSRKKKEKNVRTLEMSVRRKLLRFDFKWLRSARNEADIRHLREDIVQEFEFAVGSYAAYRNRERFNKVRDLRSAQKSLPIAVERQEILDLLEMNQVVIVAGDTGCGKSTQLPRYLLEAGYGKIACTQPRRIACTALAKRVAFETLNQYGNKVAYQIRFEKTKTRVTRILFLTEGLLLRQLASDKNLNQYNVIILDEVHERNLHGDLLVALLRDVIPRRPDLKLILMSATINLELFKSYFENTPVVQVPGRLYPIELKYMPVREHDMPKNAKIDVGPYLRILQMIDQKYPSKDRGDVLIFVNGMAAISTIAEGLKKYAEHSKHWIILRLHSSLTEEEQDKVFDMAPAGVRKCIISTNIAETSLTIDEIRFVIDSGKVNLAKYDPITRSSRLTDCWVSKASANQRMGRAGRTGPGVCFRLYSSDHFHKMEDFTPSEIRRVSLDSLILQILGMKLNWNVEDFPFLERPDEEAFKEAITSLQSQGVLTEESHNVLTPLGEILSMLPVDVAIGKMLVYSCVMDQLEVVLTVAAGLSVQSPFTNQSFQSSSVVKKREEMMSSVGDPFVLVNVYREWLEAKARNENTREWCRDRGIDEPRLYEISKLRRQFAEILEQANLIEKEEEESTKFERRVRAGDKRRLRELKKEARFKEKTRKVLKYEKHFDSFMDIDEEGDQNDPLKEISFLEFAVAHNQREVSKVIRAHKLRDLARPVVKMIIASGLYPQVAMEHNHNVHTYGHAQLAYCRSKPFVKIHPNGCLSQYPHFMDIEQDHSGVSDNHHLLYYGMLLETTDPFLVNTAKIPAVLLISFARSVIHTEPRIICCDGFIEFIFDHDDHALEVFEQTCDIRRKFAESMARKLANQKYGGRELDRKVEKLSRSPYPLRLRRIMYPPVGMLLGVHSLKGEAISFATTVVKDDSADDLTSQDSQESKEAKDGEEPEEKKGKLQRFCQFCQKTLNFVSPTDAARHMRSHKEQRSEAEL